MECYFGEGYIAACSQFCRQRGDLLLFLALLMCVAVLHLQYFHLPF